MVLAALCTFLPLAGLVAWLPQLDLVGPPPAPPAPRSHPTTGPAAMPRLGPRDFPSCSSKHFHTHSWVREPSETYRGQGLRSGRCLLTRAPQAAIFLGGCNFSPDPPIPRSTLPGTQPVTWSQIVPFPGLAGYWLAALGLALYPASQDTLVPWEPPVSWVRWILESVITVMTQ